MQQTPVPRRSTWRSIANGARRSTWSTEARSAPAARRSTFAVRKRTHPFQAVTVGLADPEIVLASSPEGIFRSEDGGRHFRRSTGIVIDPELGFFPKALAYLPGTRDRVRSPNDVRPLLHHRRRAARGRVAGLGRRCRPRGSTWVAADLGAWTRSTAGLTFTSCPPPRSRGSCRRTWRSRAGSWRRADSARLVSVDARTHVPRRQRRRPCARGAARSNAHARRRLALSRTASRWPTRRAPAQLYDVAAPGGGRRSGQQAVAASIVATGGTPRSSGAHLARADDLDGQVAYEPARGAADVVWANTFSSLYRSTDAGATRRRPSPRSRGSS